MGRSFSAATIAVGEELGRREIAVTGDLVATCAGAIESARDWYCGESPWGGPIAPPTFFDNDTLRLLDERYERFGSIHARQSWEFLRAVKLGERITVIVRVVDKFEKRGGDYVVMELVALDAQGSPVCRGLHTSLVTLAGNARRPAARVAEEQPS